LLAINEVVCGHFSGHVLSGRAHKWAKEVLAT
jgi:hypothetical protein